MEIETFLLAEHDWVPNNPKLPVILYRKVLAASACEAVAATFEGQFQRHGWPPQWRDGVYDYHHYHSTAHEVLGVAAGEATLVIGGPGGRELKVSAGDVLLLPVGTGHCATSSSDDFLVVGAYPAGQQWDVCREAPSQQDRDRMNKLPFPSADPVLGLDGPLSRHWVSSAAI